MLPRWGHPTTRATPLFLSFLDRALRGPGRAERGEGHAKRAFWRPESRLGKTPVRDQGLPPEGLRISTRKSGSGEGGPERVA